MGRDNRIINGTRDSQVLWAVIAGICKISKSLTRIKHSAAGILPGHIDKPQDNERIQLRDECYTPQIKDAAPSPDLADAEDDAKVQKSDRSAIQDMLAFLFGE